MNKFRTFLLGLSAVVVLTALTACGGSDDNKSGGILGGASSGSSTSSSSSNSGSSSSGSNSGSSSGSSSGGTLDLSKSAKNLQDLKSFNFDISLKMNLGDLGSSSGSSGSNGGLDLSGLGALLGNVKATGSFVGPDKTSLTASALGQDFSFIQIGKDSYTKQGSNGKWTKSSSSDSPLDSLTNGGLSSNSSIPPDALKNAKVTKETVNGVKATRYSFDRNALQALSNSTGSSSATDTFKDFDKAQMDIWVSDDSQQIPVKMTMDLSGKDDKKQNIGMQIEFNLKDLNSNSIQIKAPI